MHFFKKEYLSITLISVLFLLVYASISLVNHYMFRTYTYDLGIFNQAIYDYSKFSLNNNTAIIPHFDNLLSDHMCLLLIPFSFSRYLFGTYSLLIIQIVSVVIGGIGCYKYFKLRSNSNWLANLSAIHFLSFIGIFTALSFDYHNNVVAAMFIPWFYYFFHKNEWLKSTLILVFIILAKENMPLLMVAICIGLLITSRKKKERFYLASMIVLCFLYFVLVMEVIMPSIANEGMDYKHFDYAILGSSWGEGLKNIISQPLYYLKYLFANHTANPEFDGLKTEFYIAFLLCGGFAAVINPRYLIPLGLILLQKVFHDSPGKWGMYYQYAVELAPIITFSLFELILIIKKRQLKLVAAIASTVICIYVTIDSIENKNLYWLPKEQIKFYSSIHYQAPFDDVGLIKKQIHSLPKEAAISAESELVPHLAFRDKIYMFPDVSDAEYIVLLPTKDRHYYINSLSDYFKKIDDFKASDEWSVHFEGEELLIFRRLAAQN